jgi:glyoxylase-like metal-dependent hydrolase (beta-lactamase superfamily II)
VVLTHGHFDHVGFARRARRVLGVPVYIPDGEQELVAHPWRYDHERSRLPYFLNPRFVRIFTAMGIAGALWVKGTEEVQAYGANGPLDIPGKPHVVPTPGHTHGHCSLHFPDRGAVIAGDAVVTLDPYTGAEGPQIVSGAATADSPLALASLDALASTGAETVLSGHGTPWREGVRSAVEQARERGPS